MIIGISRFENAHDNIPEQESLRWDELIALLTVHDIRSEKDGPLFSAVTYPEGATRANANVETVTAAVVDLDHDVTLEDVRYWTADYATIIYSTWRHTADTPRLRVVMPFEKPIAARHWPRVWPRLAAFFGGVADKSCRDVARMMYLPACPPETAAESIAEAHEGRWLKPRDLPEADDEEAPQVAPAPTPESLNGHRDQAAQWVISALNGEVDKVAAAEDGFKHTRLLASAMAVAGYLWVGAYTAADVEASLYGAVEGRAQNKRQALRTIRDGIRYGQAKPRLLPEFEDKPPPRNLRLVRGKNRGNAEPAPEAEAESEENTKSGQYVVRGNKIYTAGGTCVCDLRAKITQHFHYEDGNSIFHIKGHTAARHGKPGLPFEFDIPAADFTEERRLKAALVTAGGAGAVIRHGQTGHIVTAIQSLSDPDHIQRYRRTGWKKDQFLIPGRGDDTTEIILERTHPYSLEATGTVQEAEAALVSLLESHDEELAAVAVSALLEAPLAMPAGWRDKRYALFLAGTTNSLKTSWMTAALCIYGAGWIEENHITKWGQGATINSIMDRLIAAGDMPFVVDNFKPGTGGGARDLINLVHMALEGGERGRLDRNGRQRATRPCWGWPVFTGEDVPGNDAATAARMLVIPWAWPDGTPNERLYMAQELCGALPAIGRQWIEWLETEAGRAVAAEIGPLLNRYRTNWARLMQQPGGGMVGTLRVATNLASNELTWQVAAQCPALRDIVNSWTAAHRKGLERVAQTMTNLTTEALEANRYIGAIRELLATGSAVVVGRTVAVSDKDRDHHIGWWDDKGGAWLLPAVTKSKVLRVLGGEMALGGISDQALYRQLAKLGLIESTGADKTTKSVKVDGTVHRVLHLNAKALGNSDDEETEEGNTSGNTKGVTDLSEIHEQNQLFRE